MKKILTILMCILLVPIVLAQDPKIITYETPLQNWFQRLFQPTQFAAIGVTFDQQEVSRGGYVTPRIKVDYGHDCEKYEVSFMFMSQKTGSFGEMYTEVKEIPHQTGDVHYYSFANLPTEDFPDSLCGEMIGGYGVHRLYYDGSWHMETSSYTTNLFKLNCQAPCEQKKIGSPFCKSNGVEVIQEWQWQDCTKGHYTTVDYCYPNGCSNGQCLEPCETGNIGSEFCKDNSIYQKVGLGSQGGQCAFKDQLIESCSSNQLCDAGQCVNTETCGDGTCSNDETYNTCPEDCEKPWFCGDGSCNEDETEESCPVDCQFGCSEGDEQKETCEDETIIISYICQDGEWKETGNKCPDEPKIPSWLIPSIVGFLFVGGTILILLQGKKKNKKKK